MTRPEIGALARLARRTARRNWKRTALIVALIAIPVAGAQVTAGMIAAGETTQEEFAARELGTADVNVVAVGSTPEVRAWVADEIAGIAPNADVLAFRTVHGAAGGVADFVEITDLDITDPLAEGMLGLVDGRLPTGAGEVALSDALMTLTDSRLGDDVELEIASGAGGLGSFTVVGAVRDVLYKNRTVAIVSEPDMDGLFARKHGSDPASGAVAPAYRESVVDGVVPVYREAHWLVGGVDDWEFAVTLEGRWERAKRDSSSESRPCRRARRRWRSWVPRSIRHSPRPRSPSSRTMPPPTSLGNWRRRRGGWCRSCNSPAWAALRAGRIPSGRRGSGRSSKRHRCWARLGPHSFWPRLPWLRAPPTPPASGGACASSG